MFDDFFLHYASFLKALAHPRRLEIVHLLRDQELHVSDIFQMLDLPQANISQHLNVLREAQIVSTRRDGKHIYYRLRNQELILASDMLRSILVQHYPNLEEVNNLMVKGFLPVTNDPVCGMKVSSKTASFRHQHNGHWFFFCASGCMRTFKEHPEKYLKEQSL